MGVLIDEFSVKPLYLELILNGLTIGSATGFILKNGTLFYLITNWHVVTGKDPETNLALSPSGAIDPDKMRVYVHGLKLGQWLIMEISLLQEGKKQWLEHPAGKEVDVVAIPIIPAPNYTIYDLALVLADFDLMIYPSETVSIIGFPQGITSSGMLPIWKTGHVASDIDIDWKGRPAFLIDATTKSGMSGSPVIAKRVSIYQTSNGNSIGNAVKFLGVYSGRHLSSEGIEIGVVWKPRVINEILSM